MTTDEYEDYWWASWLHAEGHEQAGSDPELCDLEDCPHSVVAHDLEEDE
jgi:hypothetical protein